MPERRLICMVSRDLNEKLLIEHPSLLREDAGRQQEESKDPLVAAHAGMLFPR